MLKFNRDDLPILLVQGKVRHSKGAQAYRHTIDGEPFTLPATGGITFNAKIGDRCVGWAADHLEPGVTARNENDEYNAALQGLSCVYRPLGRRQGSRRLRHRQTRRLRASAVLF